MAKFYVTKAVELRVHLEIEADSMEQAKEKAFNDYIEITDEAYQYADLVECYPVGLEDENGNYEELI